MTNTTTTKSTVTIFAEFGGNGMTDLTVEDLATMATLAPMIGKRVRRTSVDGHTMEGILTSVYYTDGPAANVSDEASGSFSLGPLYGDKIEEVA